MISRSSLPVMLMSAVGLIAPGVLAPWGATKAVADPNGDRLGCATTYCQNAGTTRTIAVPLPASENRLAALPGPDRSEHDH